MGSCLSIYGCVLQACCKHTPHMLLPRTCDASQSQQQQQQQDPGSAASMQPHGANALPYPGSAMQPCQLRRADGCDALLRGGLRALFLVAPGFGQ